MMDLIVIIHLFGSRYVVLLDLLGEILSLYDVVSEDETTKIGGSRAIDKVGPSNRCCIRYR